MKLIYRKFWAIVAISLGVWEASAYLTRKKIPTISHTCWTLQTREDHVPKLTKAVILLFCMGLARHLARELENV